MPSPKDCREISSKQELRDRHQKGDIIVQRQSMIRRPVQEMENAIEHMNEPDNPHWEKGDVLACPTDYPNGESKTKYHVSPSENEESIQENGLMPSPAQKSCGHDGVYVTETREQAEGWAETLGAEQGHDEYTVFEVDVPKDLRVEKDREPINQRAVPESEVVCTEKGFTQRQVIKAGEIKVDPSARQNMGGFR